MGGRSSDSDTERSRKGKKVFRSKRSRSRSSSASESSGSSDKRKYSSTSKYDPRNRTSAKSKSSRRHTSRNRDRKDFSRSSHSSRQDRRYYQRSRSRSRERCKSKDSDSTKKLISNPSTSSLSLKTPSSTAKSTEDQLKMKMQLALKAAADADALLRQQGLLTAKAKEWGRNSEQDNTKLPKPENKWPKEPPLSVKEQIDRAKALEEINAPEFQSQAFVSGIPLSVLAKETERVFDTHDSAIFGGVTDPNLMTVPKPAASSASKNVCIAHENLFANIEMKEEKWIKKLMLMRQRKLNVVAIDTRWQIFRIRKYCSRLTTHNKLIKYSKRSLNFWISMQERDRNKQGCEFYFSPRFVYLAGFNQLEDNMEEL
uniref:Uncharacterized protein n=1 Tax=Strigamia maritima TaxID=126957 RepID=T1IW16_STRMM